MKRPSLATRSVASTCWNAVATLTTSIVGFIRLAVLGRLIQPEVFGVIAMATAVLTMASMVAVFGFNAALMHRSPESSGDAGAETHFVLTLLSSSIVFGLVGLGVLVFVPPGRRWVYWVFIGAGFVNQMTNTPQTLWARRVQFRSIALFQITSVVLSSALAVFLAWLGHPYWALLISSPVNAILGLINFYIVVPAWRPRLRWHPGSVRYFLNFGRRTFLASLLGTALDRVDDLLTGALMGDRDLGFYSRAYSLATYPSSLLSTPVKSVAANTYAALKYDRERLSKAFVLINAGLIRLGFLLGGALVLSAHEVVFLVLGEIWLPVVTTFSLMLVFTLLNPVKLTVASVLVATGKPERVTKARLVQFIVMIGGIFLLAPTLGIDGVALAVDVMLVVGIIILLIYSRQEVDFSLWKLFGLPAASVVAAGFLTLTMSHLLALADCPALCALVAKTAIFSLAYISPFLFFERPYLTTMYRYGANAFAKART